VEECKRNVLLYTQRQLGVVVVAAAAVVGGGGDLTV
jgi:hypothetical protein